MKFETFVGAGMLTFFILFTGLLNHLIDGL